MDPFCVHFDKTLVQLAWQFEGGKCPLTYLIPCTVFLAPYALQIANSCLNWKSLEDTVKFRAVPALAWCTNAFVLFGTDHIAVFSASEGG